MYVPIILSFIIALITTSFFVPICIPIIKRFGFIDDPKTHKHPAILHTKPIPRGGGIPLFIGVVLTSLFFIPINTTTITLFVASLIAVVVGTLDDKYDLSPYVRFGINIICGIIVICGGLDFAFITNPFGGIIHMTAMKYSTTILGLPMAMSLSNVFTPGVIHLDAIRFTTTIFGFAIAISLSNILTLSWIVWVMNMLNWSKGVDGQMPGVVAISAIVIGLLSLRFPISEQATYIAATLSFIIAGSMIGFLIYNFHPAKILPGYGATAIYLLLASVSLISTAKLATAILVMGVPMVDAGFTIIRRISAKQSPFKGDKKHLHHLLLNLGLSQRQIAIIYWGFSIVLGIIALTLSSRGKVFAIFMLAVIIGGGILFLHRTISRQDD